MEFKDVVEMELPGCVNEVDDEWCYTENEHQHDLE